VEKSFDDQQLPATAKLFFALIGFVFTLGDNQSGKIPANV
jgi:hypothetical protein